MTYLQGVDVFLVMCLMVVYIDVSMASFSWNKAEEKTDQMSVTFNKLYLIDFSQQYLYLFSDCLCSPDTESCRFSYYHDGIRESKYYFKVNAVNSTNSRRPTHVVEDEVFVCDKPTFFSNIQKDVQCERQNLSNTSCYKPSNHGLYKWNFQESTCTGCINLCWLYPSVTFNQTSRGYKPEGGRCKPGSSPTRHASGVSEPDKSAIRELTSPSTLSRAGVRHATEPPVRTTNFPVVTTTTDKVSPVEKSNGTNTNASDSNLPKFNEKGRAHFVGLATVLVVMATIVIVLVLYRRRKQRARENPRGKLVSGTDTQPPSYSGAEDVDYSQVLDTVPSSHGECGISSPAYRGTVSSTHGECGISSSAYPDDTVYTGSIFSIITDGHVTSPIFATTSTSEYSDVSEVRQALSAKEEIPQSVGRVGVNNSTSEPGEGDIRSGEKVMKTAVGAYSKITKRALRPKKEQNKERSENKHIYSTLSLRRAYPSDEERRSVLNTYNMASEVFKQDLGHPATENEDAVQFGDLYSVIQPIYSIHTDLNTKLGKGGSHEHASCECTPHDFDELRAHVDYFILEDDVDGDEDAAYSSSSGSASGIYVTADLEVVENAAYRAIYEVDTSQSNVDSDIERSDNLVLENFMRSDSQQLLIDRSHSVSDAGFQETEYFDLEENADLFDGDVQLGEEGHNEDFNHCHDERDPYSEIDVSHVYREKASNWEKN